MAISLGESVRGIHLESQAGSGDRVPTNPSLGGTAFDVRGCLTRSGGPGILDRVCFRPLATGILGGAIERQEDDHKAGFRAKPFVVVASFSAEARQGHRGCLTGTLARACESGSALGPPREPASLPLAPGVLGGAIQRQEGERKTRTGDRCKANRGRVRQIAVSG